MSAKEAKARIKINKLLEEAGWCFFDNASGSANVVLEPNVKLTTAKVDALGDNYETTTNGFIDFLLLNDKGFPFIVLEAKSEDKSPLVGKEQARKYARSQNCRFVILSNGNLHYFWDLERGNPYVITTFPTPTSVSGYQKTIPDSKRLVEELVKDDYIVLTQRPGYAAEAAWKNEAERFDPEWPIIELSEICSFKNGLNFDKNSSGFTVKIIGVSDFQNNLYAPLDNLDEVHLNAPLAEDYLVKTGDILFVRSNGNSALVGRSVIVPPTNEPTTFSGFTIRGRREDERAYLCSLHYSLNQEISLR